METKKFLSVLVILLVCSGFKRDEAWVVDPESNLAIHGNTNVNSFVCEVHSYPGRDTLRYYKNYPANELQFTCNHISIPVRNFDCGSPMISKDFRTALKSERYPELVINFVSLQTAELKNNSCVTGAVDITLAGVTTRYNIAFSVNVSSGSVLLSGEHPVNFSDFKLTAPSRLNGLVRVKEVLRVHLHLVMRAV